MSAPKFLYHGTTGDVARKAMVEGLKPRGAHGGTNFKHTIESNPDTIYLTDAYPLFFGINACDHARPKTGEAAVIQLDVDRLNQLWLVPDEDVLEQAGRNHDGIPGTMKQRTRHYRDNLRNYVGSDAWQASLRGMGTCGFRGVIPPEAISKVAFVDTTKAPTLAIAASDASICLSNYRFCATKYRNLTNRLFGLPVEPDPLHGDVLNVPDDAPPEILAIRDHYRTYEQALAADIAAGVRVEDLRQMEAA